jgi:uncharacterized protein YkwD
VVVLLAASGLVALPSAPATAMPSATTAAADAQAMFQLLNRERAAHGLSPLRWRARLVSAAHSHNLLMRKYTLVSHQLPGEPTLGERVSVTGYRWRALGENIGYTEDWTLTGILRLQRVMYAEVAPYDPHRRNILSKTFRDIGIDIVMDGTHHKAWVSQVFGLALG